MRHSDLLDALPHHLTERVHVLQSVDAALHGDCVLYWMHHAARGHDNPALDVALTVAQHLDLPVLVLQNFSARQPYASDRHLRFLLEGALDVQRELRQRGISYAFHLAPGRGDRAPLPELADRAALTVVEAFPAPPFPSWNRRLTERTAGPAWSVDASCIVPMTWAGRPLERAFQFRRALQGEFDRRVPVPWDDDTASLQTTPRPFEGDLGFEPLDLENADLDEVCARCDIDHAVGPVPHTRGGSVAGYARWQRFVTSGGLRHYARRRNDAARDGVSRLSPYLHHGHVSPFRIAREAHQEGSDGAAKYLDELLVWRELSYNVCWHLDDPESWDALPAWARQTLDEHADDPRPAVYSWEQLARGRTGSPLWDAAQASLRIHGELHNNVRMTWGKALLQWTASPRDALRTLIDLNHRYALDGSNPNSYGGLLWWLGLFDRPFTPPKPVLGTVRPRSVRQHARRLDLGRYRAKVTAPARGDALRVAVVGAGLSGLFAGRILQDHGLQVAVFEAGPAVGGRSATLGPEHGGADHGAQYFTQRDPRLRPYLASWLHDGLVAPWSGRIAVAKHGQIELKNDTTARYVGRPGMDALARHLAADLDIALDSEVRALRPQENGWRLTLPADTPTPKDTASFDVVLLAAPPARAAPLLADAPQLADAVRDVTLNPCWALTVVFEEAMDLPFDGAFVHDAPLSWVADNGSKPGRREGTCWVLHGSPTWSSRHRENSPNAVTEALLQAFFEATGAAPQTPRFTQLTLWNDAIASTPLDVGCLWDPARRLGVCGDWCHGSRVEGALLSGMAMAGRVLGLPDRDEVPVEH